MFLDQDGKELYAIELMLISQIIPFMFVTAKHTSEQCGLEGHCVLVLADLKKVQTSLPRTCNDDHLITLICNDDHLITLSCDDDHLITLTLN